MKFTVRTSLRPKVLKGISEEQLVQHWALYEGYVKNVNLLNERLRDLSGKHEFGPEFTELKRRQGFEYDGMILHELYFDLLKADQKPLTERDETFKLLESSFGGFLNWKEEFTAVGMMRGVGWAILYFNPRTKTLMNSWIGMHESGHPVGFVPILVLDAWEHAYMVDHSAAGRAGYIDAFFNNVDWRKVERNLSDALRAAADLPLEAAR
jgi:Fe-Mn family superoxide dismutase